MKYLRKLVNILLLIIVLTYTSRLFVGAALISISSDLAAYITASSRMYSGQDVYNHIYNQDLAKLIFGDTPPSNAVFTMHYFYPPFLAALIRPLTKMSFAEAKYHWACLNFGMLLLISAVFAQLCKKSVLAKYCFITRFNCILLAFSTYDPCYSTFFEGQVNLMLLASAVLFLLFWEKGWLFLSGVLLGFPALIKMSPALLLLGPLRAAKKMIVISFLLTCAAALAALIFSSIPFNAYGEFFLMFGRLASGGIEVERLLNLTLSKSFLFPFGCQEWRIAHIFIKLPILLAVLILLWKSDSSHPQYPRHATSLLVFAMIFLSPITWAHHLVWLSIPFISLITNDTDERTHHLPFWVLLTGLYIFLGRTSTMQSLALLHAPKFIPVVNMLVNAALLIFAYLVVKALPLKDKRR